MAMGSDLMRRVGWQCKAMVCGQAMDHDHMMSMDEAMGSAQVMGRDLVMCSDLMMDRNQGIGCDLVVGHCQGP